MSSLNKVILIGNLGRDPEIRHTQSGDKIANLNLATSERWKDRNSGEYQERTEWHRVTVFGALADVVDKYVRKGSKVYIEGALKTRKWQDKDGQERYTTEVNVSGFGGRLMMLDGKGAGSEPDRSQTGAGSEPLDLDDDLPF